MSQNENQRNQLLQSLSRGIAYAMPVLAIVAVGAGSHAIISDAVAEDGYQMTATAAEGQAEAEGGSGAEAEAEGESETEAEGEGEGEAEPEAEGEAEA